MPANGFEYDLCGSFEAVSSVTGEAARFIDPPGSLRATSCASCHLPSSYELVELLGEDVKGLESGVMVCA